MARPLPITLTVAVAVGFLGPAIASDPPPLPPEDARVLIYRERRSGQIWTSTYLDGRILDRSRSSVPSNSANLSLSPDGRRVALTSYQRVEPQRRFGSRRSVQVIALLGGVPARMPTQPEAIAFGAGWSHDGRSIAANVFDGSRWQLATWQVGGDRVQVIPGVSDCFVPRWDSDGAHLLCQDLASISRVGLNVPRNPVVTFADVLPGTVSTHSPATFDVSCEGQHFVFEVTRNDSRVFHGIRELYVLSPRSRSAVAIAPNKLMAHSPSWIGRDTIMFIGAPLNGANVRRLEAEQLVRTDLYVIDLSTQRARVVLRDVSEYAVQRRCGMVPNPELQSDGASPRR